MTRIRRYIFPTLLLLTAVALFVWWRSGSNATSAPQSSSTSQHGPIKVSATVVHSEPFSESLLLSGEVRPAEYVDVFPEVSGKVVAIQFQEGALVRAHQVLFQLDDAEERAQLERLHAQFQLDSAQLRRLESMRKLDGVSLQDLDAAKSQVRVRKAEIEEATAALEKTRIKAPFNGHVGLRMVSIGAVVSPQTRLTTLADVASLKVDIAVPDRYAYAVRVGSQLQCIARNNVGADTVLAQVYATEPAVDASTRTLRIRARMPQSASIVPGTIVDVALQASTIPHAIMVPSQSIQQGMKGASVYVVTSGTAHEVQVTLGGRTADRVHVVDGLKNGDTVATSGLLVLKDGLPVEAEVDVQLP